MCCSTGSVGLYVNLLLRLFNFMDIIFRTISYAVVKIFFKFWLNITKKETFTKCIIFFPSIVYHLQFLILVKLIAKIKNFTFTVHVSCNSVQTKHHSKSKGIYLEAPRRFFFCVPLSGDHSVILELDGVPTPLGSPKLFILNPE